MNNLSMFLQAGGQASGTSTIIMMVLLFAVFYFFMIRPQQKKARDARKFRENLQKGARVVTIGGLHGKVVEVNEKTVLLEVADGVKLRFEKSAVAMDNSMQLTEDTAKTA